MTDNGKSSDRTVGSTDDATTEQENVERFPARLRVHALARLLGLTSREVLGHLADLEIAARTAQSSIGRAEAEAVAAHLEAAEAENAEAESAAADSAADENPEAPAAEAAAPETPVTETSATETSATETEPAPVAEPEPTAETATQTSLFSAAAEQRDEPLPVVADTVAAPLFLPPEPAAATPARDSRDEPSTGERDTHTAETDGDDAAGHDADSPDTDGADSEDGRGTEAAGEGRSSRRRRRGRRGRGRGRGENGAGTDGDDAADSENAAADSDGGDAGAASIETKDADAKDADGQDTDGKPAEDDKSGSGAGEQGEQDAADGEADEAADGGTAPSSKRRRRRRRRRSGSDDEGVSPDDPPNTVIHEREPRSKRARDEVQGISGSTRLEAKRQRRRDGRDAGRRRPPILTESEFLARREAVDRVMVVRERHAQHHADGSHGEDYTQVAVLEDGVLVEHFVTTETSSSMVGNIYLGRVQNVLPGMEAAFVDIGRGRNGVLYAGEVNWDAAGLDGGSRKIEQALKPGDTVLVQVSKDPVGHKGARLTTQISLAGRYLVYVPGGTSTGISRKLPDTERKRLKSILSKLVPENAGVIIRTASEGISAEDLGADIERLERKWQAIEESAGTAKKNGSGAPQALYEEPDLLVRVVRDLFNEDFKKLVVEGDKAWSLVRSYVSDVAPDLLDRVEEFTKAHADAPDSFAVHRIDEQLAKALDKKVWLPSGGTLIIEHTEAMTVIDVNTGKFTGSGGNLEETVTRNNLEAAEEIVRQMRLRDLGGMIIVDFIDMVLESNRDLVLRRLTEALARDRTRHQVSEVTSLGLVQMTRKRLGTGLLEAFSTTCTACNGRGVIVRENPVETRSSEDSGRSDSGRRSRRSRRRSDAPAEAEAKPVANPAEHPMFRAMAAGNDGEASADRGDNAASREDTSRTEAQPEAKPAETKPAESKPAETEPTESKPAETEPTESRPAETEVEPKAGVAEADSGDAPAAEAPRRRRRAARRAAAAPVTVEPQVEAAPAKPVTTVAGTVSQPVVEVKRRTRRRAAGRPSGPPVGEE